MTAFYIRTYMDCNCEKLLNKLCNVRSTFYWTSNQKNNVWWTNGECIYITLIEFRKVDIPLSRLTATNPPQNTATLIRTTEDSTEEEIPV